VVHFKNEIRKVLVMLRKPRFLPNIPVHGIIRGSARQVVFAEDSDRQASLAWLKEASVLGTDPFFLTPFFTCDPYTQQRANNLKTTH